MIHHIAILVGSSNFAEEAEKLGINTQSANYKSASNPRRVGTYYVVSVDEDGYICFTTFRKGDELSMYEEGTLTVIS